MMWDFAVVQMMQARHEELVRAVAGLRATGVPLVGLDHGRLYAAGGSDFNFGMYLLVSVLARVTGLSADAAATLFFYGVLVLALVVGGLGWWRYARATASRLLFVPAALVLAAIALHFGDEYIVLAAVPIGCVPPLLALWRRGGSRTAWLWALSATGLAAGTASLVRAEAGLVACAFAAVLALGRTRETRRWRALQLGLLAAGVALPFLVLRGAQLYRDRYLARVVSGYTAPTAPLTMWHSAYIGFGFLANDKGLRYDDNVAALAVARVAPGTVLYSRRYNAVIRHEVFQLVVRDPAFVARTLFAKAGVLLLYLVLFGNVGLVAAARRRKPAALDLAFAAGLAAAAFTGMLALPILRYMEGFTALALLYGLTSVDWALAPRRSPT